MFFPDKTPTQRIGIVPDVVVVPTIAGLGAGRDVLEAGIRAVLGTSAPAAEVAPFSKATRAASPLTNAPLASNVAWWWSRSRDLMT